MKRYLISIVLMAGFLMSKSQLVSFDYILEQEHKEIPIYHLPTQSKSAIILNLGFGNSSLSDRHSAALVRLREYGVPIERIDIVYSKFQRLNTFNQDKLNKKRFKNLQRVFPELFENNLTEWNLIGQTESTSLEEAKDLFHGIVIYLHRSDAIRLPKNLRNKKLSPREEIALMKKILSGMKTTTLVKVTPTKVPVKKIRSIKEPSGEYNPILKWKRKKGITFPKKGIWKGRKPVYNVKRVPYDGFSTGYVYDSTHAYSYPRSPIVDTVVLAVLARLPDLGKYVIAEDVTGSMYPYTAQVIMWKRMHKTATEADKFVFFNDGDAHPDGKIGASGGQYFTYSNDLKEIEDATYAAMYKGGGGMCPENDLESVIFAIEQCEECAGVILIADNWAAVRDMELLHKVSKPVRVIICGSNGDINIDYLRIARATGGSVHTIEQDLSSLWKMNEGESLEVGTQKFRIEAGKFVLER